MMMAIVTVRVMAPADSETQKAQQAARLSGRRRRKRRDRNRDGNEHQILILDPGTYVITEDEVSGWQLDSIVCDLGAVGTYQVNLAANRVTVQLPNGIRGGNLDCTFNNTQRGNVGALFDALFGRQATPTPLPAALAPSTAPAAVTPPRTGDAGLADGT